MTLAQLAERVGALTGPDREVDALIAAAVHTKMLTYAESGEWLTDPPYTASLDAALSLVPEGWRAGFEQPGLYDRSELSEAWCWPFDSSFEPDWQMGHEGYRSAPDATKGFAATPALALTAAAIRARGEG